MALEVHGTDNFLCGFSNICKEQATRNYPGLKLGSFPTPSWETTIAELFLGPSTHALELTPASGMRLGERLAGHATDVLKVPGAF